MGMFLNSIASYAKYKILSSSIYFVDKTSLINDLIKMLGEETPYICVTRPRRFGKTVAANMLGAFFNKSVDSSDIFDRLQISGAKDYRKHLNHHDIIYIDFSEVPRNCDCYQQYIERIENGLLQDLMGAYPDISCSPDIAVWDLLSLIFEKEGQQRFIFILDEWDAVFHMPCIKDKDKEAYLLFLKSLLKSKVYVEMAYMTGILSIAKYSGGSELNMFSEYSMATMELFSDYFGFTEDEVDSLFMKYKETCPNPKITREGLRIWYDGYHTAADINMYNPQSVVFALKNNQLSNYWTKSGPYDEIFYYIRNNILDIQDDLALMISGESVPAQIQEYAATVMELKTKDEIYSAMVVYGLLTYKDGCVSIPNRELMNNFAALSKKLVGYDTGSLKIS